MLSASGVWSIGQTEPAKHKSGAATVDVEPSIGSLRVRELPAFDFLYISRETTLPGMSQLIGTELPKLFISMKAHGIQPSGPVVFIYHNANGSPEQRFKVDMGIEVRDAAAAPAGYQLSHLAAARCGTVLYGGSMTNLTEAYKQLFADLATRDLISTGETREYYLSWDGVDSVDNVVWLAACAE